MGMINDIFGPIELMSKEEMSEALELIDIFTTMSSAAKEVLLQLRDTGPVWDGDVISKAGRSELLTHGMAVKACVKGKQGYQVCTYRGWDLAKLIERERAEKAEKKKPASSGSEE
jgi:hypothetical protein